MSMTHELKTATETTSATAENHAPVWNPGTLTDTQTAGLLSLCELWSSVTDVETVGRARAALQVLERRQRELALEVAAAREQAALEVQRDVQTLAATFQRGREQAVQQATELAWAIAEVLVATSPGPSPALRQEVQAFMRQHGGACLRVPPACSLHFDVSTDIHIIEDDLLSDGMMSIDVSDGRFVLDLNRLRELIHHDVTTHVRSSTRRVSRKSDSHSRWGDA